MSKIERPIVVGALGGSGTRVVAEILQAWGVDMGKTLNESNDELLFTHLFKRPRFVHAVSDKKLQQRLRAYAGLRVNGELSPKNTAKFVRAALDPIHEMDTEKVKEMIQTYSSGCSSEQWGWKEPNSHVILPHMVSVFPKMKFVHVIRHGYAMAMSNNTQQLELWGPHYGVSEKSIEFDEIKAQFRYWRIANRGAQLVGERLLGENFLLLKFEDLVEKPKATLEGLAQFLGMDISGDQMNSAISFVEKPKDFNRGKKVTQEQVGDDGTSLPLFGY